MVGSQEGSLRILNMSAFEHPATALRERPMYERMQAGEVIDQRFKLLAHIADGGVGSVYRAESIHGGPPLAIKILHPEFANNKEVIERLRREASSSKSIDHPGIIDIFSFNTDPEGRSYLVMEWLVGHSIEELLEKDGPFDPRYATWILLQTSRCLAAAHEQSIIHRDLKPDNIFVIEGATPAEDQVKVFDFGIAKIKDNPFLADLTLVGTVCGTPEFMSPEQARGADIDIRSDVYALGCVFFAMLTGVPPFIHANPIEVMIQQQTNPLPDLPDVIPKLLDLIMRQATEKKVERRQPSMHMFADQLHTFLNGGDVESLLEIQIWGLKETQTFNRVKIAQAIRKAAPSIRKSSVGIPKLTPELILSIQKKTEALAALRSSHQSSGGRHKKISQKQISEAKKKNSQLLLAVQKEKETLAKLRSSHQFSEDLRNKISLVNIKTVRKKEERAEFRPKSTSKNSTKPTPTKSVSSSKASHPQQVASKQDKWIMRVLVSLSLLVLILIVFLLFK